jgi:hypothetical protein
VIGIALGWDEHHPAGIRQFVNDRRDETSAQVGLADKGADLGISGGVAKCIDRRICGDRVVWLTSKQMIQHVCRKSLTFFQPI